MTKIFLISYSLLSSFGQHFYSKFSSVGIVHCSFIYLYLYGIYFFLNMDCFSGLPREGFCGVGVSWFKLGRFIPQGLHLSCSRGKGRAFLNVCTNILPFPGFSPHLSEAAQDRVPEHRPEWDFLGWMLSLSLIMILSKPVPQFPHQWIKREFIS